MLGRSRFDLGPSDIEQRQNTVPEIKQNSCTRFLLALHVYHHRLRLSLTLPERHIAAGIDVELQLLANRPRHVSQTPLSVVFGEHHAIPLYLRRQHTEFSTSGCLAEIKEFLHAHHTAHIIFQDFLRCFVLTGLLLPELMTTL